MADPAPIGVLLAAGTGMRLSPATRAVNKHLLLVYDKPMVYYSLCTLLLAGVREILVVVTPGEVPAFERLLGDGTSWGVSIRLVQQPTAAGVADGLRLCGDMADGRPVVLMLGDNLLHGSSLGRRLQQLVPRTGARILTASVASARDYGVVHLSSDGNPLSLEEKPKEGGPGLAIVGVYFYGPEVFGIADGLAPSARGEMEITDVNRVFLDRGLLTIEPLPRGTYWQDLGSPDALSAASEYVRVLQSRTGQWIGCPEEISWRQGWVSDEELLRLADSHGSAPYGSYLKSLLTWA